MSKEYETLVRESADIIGGRPAIPRGHTVEVRLLSRQQFKAYGDEMVKRGFHRPISASAQPEAIMTDKKTG